MQHKSKQAFTLIELMIVIVIITFMMLVGYAPYNFYQQKAKVKIAGREISQSIYEAKNMAISGLSFKDTALPADGNKNKSIGIVFEKDSDEIKYYEFDLQKVEAPADIVLPDNGVKTFKVKPLQDGVVFSEVGGHDRVLFFFEAITGKLYIKSDTPIDTANAITIPYGIKGTENETLKKQLQYYPATNTTFYKTTNEEAN